MEDKTISTKEDIEKVFLKFKETNNLPIIESIYKSYPVYLHVDYDKTDDSLVFEVYVSKFGINISGGIYYDHTKSIEENLNELKKNYIKSVDIML